MNGYVRCLKIEFDGLRFISKTLFFAGLAAARPGESLTPFFERYVHKQTPLKEFLDKYELALHKKRREETLSDIESLNSNTTELKTKCSFETQLSRIYTREMFKKFQVEVEEMYSCFSTTQVHVDGPFVIFLVKERVQTEIPLQYILQYPQDWFSVNAFDLMLCLCCAIIYSGFSFVSPIHAGLLKQFILLYMQVLTVGQRATFEYHGTNYIFTVSQAVTESQDQMLLA